MREYIELRFPGEHADRVLGPEEGRRLGEDGDEYAVRVVTLTASSARVQQIRRQYIELYAATGDFLFLGWAIWRRYTARELRAAPLLHFGISGLFEPNGEDCGTIYDDTSACPHCGEGRRQLSDLVLDLRRIPRNVDMAGTFAGEYIVSQRFGDVLIDHQVTGCELRPAWHVSETPVDVHQLARTTAGRSLAHDASSVGIAPGSWQFWVWANRQHNEQRATEALTELTARDRKRAIRGGRWYQLVVTSRRIPVAQQTLYGPSVFMEGEPDGDACPLGHTRGLNRLSELYVCRSDWDGSDVAVTREMQGAYRGLLRPTPDLLISQRLYRLMQEAGLRGQYVEVVRFSDS